MSLATIRTPTRKHGGFPTICPDTAWYQTAEGCADVELAWQRTGYGKKAFLVCPICGARREKLYVSNWRVGCRDHLTNGGIYRGIQYTTKGGADRIAYTMQKIATDNWIEFRVGDDPLSYVATDKRPRYMQKWKFSDVMSRLDLLERLRDRAIFAGFRGLGITADLKNNVPLIGHIERSSIEELADLPTYSENMSICQMLYRQDWGFPLIEER